jgi:hypothetical protein
VDDIQQPGDLRGPPSSTKPLARMVRKLGPHRTILSSLSSLSSEISRMAVLGTPSSSASSLIFLRATIWLLLTSRALYTTPYVPVVWCVR